MALLLGLCLAGLLVILALAARSQLGAARDAALQAWQGLLHCQAERREAIAALAELASAMPAGHQTAARALASLAEASARARGTPRQIAEIEASVETGVALALLQLAVPMRDDSRFARLRSTITGADAAIREQAEAYNQAVSALNRRIGRFPGSLIAIWMQTGEAEKYRPGPATNGEMLSV